MTSGIEIGVAKAKQAADHAGFVWKEMAYRAFEQYAREHKQFRTEEVRKASPWVGEPPDTRAWGHIALAAKKNGVVNKAGWTRAESLSVHGMIVTLWESTLCD